MVDDPDATESEDEAVAKGPKPTVKGAYSEDGLKQAVPKQDSASEPARPRPVGPEKGRRNGAEEGKKRGTGRSKKGAKTTKRKEEEAASEEDSGAEADVGMEEHKKPPKGKRKRQRKETAPDGDLPGIYGKLFALYDVVDNVCCFLLKTSLPTSIEAIEPILRQCYQGDVAFSLEVMQMLAHAGPDAIAFHYVPLHHDSMEAGEGGESASFRLELTFPTAAGIGKSHGRRRRDMVKRGLLSAAILHHQHFLLQQEGTATAEQGCVGEWHPSFLSLGLQEAAPFLGSKDLPDRPHSLAEAPSTDPYKAPPAPLVRPGTTGLARSSSSSSSSSKDGDEQHGPSFGGGDGDGPFSDAFLNNVPAQDVPKDEDDCIALAEALSYLQGLPFYQSQVAHVKHFPPSHAAYGQIKQPLPPPLQDAIRAKGVSQLFLHQATAINAVLDGQHLCLCTATSSGKSLVYTLPVLATLLTTGGRALFLFPTKALAQDQLRSLRELISANADLSSRVAVETLDGDTPHADRSAVRDHADVILSNPDMLHVTVLPQHRYWERFLRDLRFVVVDEAHMYTGVFGSHVAGVMRRLVRLCLHYGSPRGPTFITCSATIANPREHFAALVPLNVLGGQDRLTVVDKDTSPRGKKVFVLWNPPLKPSWKPPTSSTSTNQAPPRSASRRLWRTRLAQIEMAQKQQRQKHDEAGGDGSGGEGQQPVVEQQQNEEEGGGSGGDEDLEAMLALSQGPRAEAEILQEEEEGQAEGEHDGRPAGAPPSTTTAQAAQTVLLEEGDAAGAPAPPPVMLEGGGGEQEEVVVAPWAPRRRSAIVETAMILAALVKQRLRTIAFCKVRKLVEMVLRYTLQDLHATAPFLACQVKGYRGGYTKDDRRHIERDLFAGKLLGVTATCALELGVDVGNLDVTLHMGFPGTISSLWQQVCFETPVDQYFIVHPEELLDMPPERAALDAFNQYALRGQLICAADERPLGHQYSSADGRMVTDRLLFGDKAYDEAVNYLLQNERLCRVPEDGSLRRPGWIESPARDVNLRMIDPITFQVKDESRGGQVIDHVGYTRAFFELFEGAIYMHQARQYLVVKLDLVGHAALVRPVRVGYYTSSRNHTDVNLLKRLESTDDGCISSGCAQVVAKVWGYRKIWLQTGKILEMGLFSLPPLEYETRAFFIDLGLDVQQAVEAAGRCYVAGIHAVNHALLSVTPLFLLCDTGDIDTEHVYPYQQRPRPPRIVVYDKRPGGIGAAESLFDCVDDVLYKARALVQGCPCAFPEGCPACVHDYRCSDYNVVLDKEAAVIILNMLIQKQERDRRAARSTTEASDEEDVVEVKPGAGSELKITPRKAARARGLQVARAMDEARARDVTIQRDWATAFPSYRPEG